MLLSKTVKVRWGYSNKDWFIDKNYKFTNIGDEFEVKLEDLSNGSGVHIKVMCDNSKCKKIKDVSWSNYIRGIKLCGKYYCGNCRIHHMVETKLTKSKSFYDWCIENNRQDLLDRWDYKLNKLLPQEISYGAAGKYWFKCSRCLHKSEEKRISILIRDNAIPACTKCNSFEQWCIDNNRLDVLIRWDYELNKSKPSEINYGINAKYYFKCPLGIHKSELKNINSFTYRNGNMYCKACNSFALWGIDNICEDFLEKYWSDKNIINPWEIDKSSKKKVWIKCQEKDYHDDYEVHCYCFVNEKNRCPYCTNRNGRVHKLDSLGALYKESLKVWSIKNIKAPYEYSPSSKKKVWWQCECGKHEDFYRDIRTSNKYNFRCPQCSRERNESLLQEKVRLYLEDKDYKLLHEYNCSIIAQNPKIKNKLGRMPYDNELIIKNIHLIIETNGVQHYILTGFHYLSAKENNTTPEYELHKIKLYDRYKRIYAKLKGYEYLEIPYWTDNKQEEWKKLIDNKIVEIIHKENTYNKAS